jgi:hypothetical protein
VSGTKKINPDDFILSAFSPEDRLDAAFKIAGEAFKKTTLTMKDIEPSHSSWSPAQRWVAYRTVRQCTG